MGQPGGLALYGHPFSSYTWKALIALYANDTPFDFRVPDAEHPEHGEFIAGAGPVGKFPILRDGDTVVFEATSVIEYLDAAHPGPMRFLPADELEAVRVRMLDRVFDNYVMNAMQGTVDEYIRHPDNPDPAILTAVREKLHKIYRWLEGWLAGYSVEPRRITLIECAAAPSLFYADWIEPIPDGAPRLKAWRAHLLALPAVSRCVEGARPFRSWFPPGAPDRD